MFPKLIITLCIFKYTNKSHSLQRAKLFKWKKREMLSSPVRSDKYSLHIGTQWPISTTPKLPCYLSDRQGFYSIRDSKRFLAACSHVLLKLRESGRGFKTELTEASLLTRSCKLKVYLSSDYLSGKNILALSPDSKTLFCFTNPYRSLGNNCIY